ncbi:MAG: HAMP domain-containing sensor histidine kinase [Clostridia bacterium]
MKRLKLSTQIIIIILISLIVIPLLLMGFAYPEYQKNLSESIYESLDYQLTLTNKDEQGFLNSVFILNPLGQIELYKVQEDDVGLTKEILEDISTEVFLSPHKTARGSRTLEDRTKVYYSYIKYPDNSARLVLTCYFVKNTIFGNEQSLRFMSTIFLFMSIPIILILLWFTYVSQSIKSIERFVSNDEKKPLSASKELRSLQDSIEVFKTEIKEDTEQKQRLFQNISHELKTPITTIRMYAEGIEDGIYKDGDIKKSTQIIKDETEQLLQRVNKIMDINKIYHAETAAINIRTEKLILSETIFELLQLYDKRAPQVKFECELGRYEWLGNKEIWNTIIQNILDNNIKHGAKNISIKLLKDELIIENDGDKIEEEIMSKLFEPFIKGENGNYGLGLNIIQRALKLLGYSIDVKNSNIGVIYRIYS